MRPVTRAPGGGGAAVTARAGCPQPVICSGRCPWGSAARRMRGECRFAPGEAAARSRVAAAMTSEFAETNHALRQGRISWRHANVIARSLSGLPAEGRHEAEQTLQEPAATLDPMYLKQVTELLLHRLQRRGVTVGATFDGMVGLDDCSTRWRRHGQHLGSGQAPISGGDCHCIASDCCAPPQHCEVHNIVIWEDGGETTLHNCALVCLRHRTAIHSSGWVVHSLPDDAKGLLPPGARPPP